MLDDRWHTWLAKWLQPSFRDIVFYSPPGRLYGKSYGVLQG